MSTVAHRNVVIADLLPEPDGIANLVDETKDRIKSTYIAYAKRTNNAFNVSHTTVKRLTSLMYWVQDKERTSDDIHFEAGTTRAMFLEEIKVARKRANLHKDRKKIGEG